MNTQIHHATIGADDIGRKFKERYAPIMLFVGESHSPDGAMLTWQTYSAHVYTLKDDAEFLNAKLANKAFKWCEEQKAIAFLALWDLLSSKFKVPKDRQLYMYAMPFLELHWCPEQRAHKLIAWFRYAIGPIPKNAGRQIR